METRKARYERRQRARKERRRESGRARLRSLRRTLLLVAGGVAALVLVVGSLALFITTRSDFGKELPPTSYTIAHSESLPTGQINNAPIPRLVQEHVMERNAGHPKGSMLVQYNCLEYPCEPDLVEKLITIVRDFPPYVYLAPYPTMDAKIALAAPGRLLTLETLDEGKIREFISSNSDR